MPPVGLRASSFWPLVPVAPAIVVLVGALVALGIGIVGVDYLGRASDDQARARAELMGRTLSARLSALPPELRLEAMQLAARRSAAECVSVDPAGQVLRDATLGTPDPPALQKIVKDKQGEAFTRLGRARFFVSPVGPPPAQELLVVFVRETDSPEGTPGLISALLALTTLLLGVAGIVAYVVGRDASREIDFVTRRVRAMVETRVDPTGEPVPVRTMDEVGILTATFNGLVGRFVLAEKAYRGDLLRARAADRDRAAFLAAVSHELRSPLNAILGFADILLQEVDGPLAPASREEVEQIKGSGQHLLELINDILEFSAIESGQLKLSLAPVDVQQVARDVARELAVVIGKKPVRLDLVDGAPVYAMVDARRVRQILGNLIGNAIKFTQSGEVGVRVSVDERGAVISVRDTGPGISEREQRIIFEEYKQAREEKGKKRGTGLGLAITRRLVVLHKGTIELSSALGRGSTFIVHLPLANIDDLPTRRLL